MPKLRVGLVTAWAECGMGYVARNWVYTFEKHAASLEYQIYSRANRQFTPFRWQGDAVVNGPETMAIDHDHFRNWVDSFRPDVILFQDQNLYGGDGLREETARLRRSGLRLINYPDWVKWGDVARYRGLYDVNLAHVARNYRWLVEDGVECPVYIPWGVILRHFPFVERNPVDRPVTFYINLGTGTLRKGYDMIPAALRRMHGNLFRRLFAPEQLDFRFIATAVLGSEHRVKRTFIRRFATDPRCALHFQTADNTKGGLFALGDVYVYPTLKEGVGLTITEALCTGMPVITTDYPTMNEWFTDGEAGRLIRTRRVRRSSMQTRMAYADTGHLAAILRDYSHKPDEIREQSHRARRIVEERYNWDDRDAQILGLLKG